MEMHDTASSLPIANPQPGTRWFCRYGCVVDGDGVNRVFIGDRLLGEYDPRDRNLGPRNIMLVMLAQEPKIHLGHLAAAFEISNEHLRRLRQATKADGYGAVLTRARGCAERDAIAPAKIRELRALFEEGWNATDATRRQRRHGRVSRSTASRERRRWQAEKEAARGAEVATAGVAPAEGQRTLFEDAEATALGNGETPAPTLERAHTHIAIDPQPLDRTAAAVADGAVAAAARGTSGGLASEANGALATSSSEMLRDARANGQAAEDAAAVHVIAEATNADRTIAEPGLTPDRVAEGVVDALVDRECVTPSVQADDGVVADHHAAWRTDDASNDLDHGEFTTRGSEAIPSSIAETTTAEDAIDGDAMADVMNCDRALAEHAITGDDVAERVAAISENESAAARMLPEDDVAADDPVIVRATAAGSLELPAAVTNGALADDEYQGGRTTPLRARPVASGPLVQHVGSWLVMALAQQHGLHDEAERLAGSEATRIAMDATLAALAIGERTVEGVRRLATSTGPLLLRCGQMPTANSVRRCLHVFANEHGATLMVRVGERYLDAVRAEANEPAVFYVDNHLRKYTGQQVVRKGWRMQDKRVLPGASDYYVHDEDGQPVFRIDTPSHDSLCQWLMPIVTRLRAGLGAEERILLAFDRAGAFPVEMAALRDAGVEFVTYERRPYPDLAPSEFDREIVIRGETYSVHESRLKNLGAGRGRVRRIAVRAPDGKQINLLAISTAPLERLVGVLMGGPDPKAPSGRWQQENALKHGAERWGINQLDGRKVEPYPPGTIIPNPARRRNERALKIARADEGRARCALADAKLTDVRRARIESDLADAIQRRVALELARPLIPSRAPIEQTELAGKLVRHPAKLKAVVDTMRIVCANVEAELADIIAPALTRPREAKKVIANVFAAPGRIDVTTSEIRVRLSPAANRSEHAAIQRLLAEITARRLTLPGDIRDRPLRFELHIS